MGGGGNIFVTVTLIYNPGVAFLSPAEHGRNISIWILVCSLENVFPQYNEIISTSKLPFHNPLVMKYYNVLAYFSSDYKNCPFTKYM